MIKDRNFLYITFADLVVRSAYQMGKTPLLPIFAAMLGATDILLGFIVSVSTITGMLLKPLVGLLSDRWGRRSWLLVGTAFFGFIPFLYWLIETPDHLVIVRIIHGTATAIYGPVTVAYVAENAGRRRAEKLGWFGNARSAGYIVGPVLGGWLLLNISPQWIFTIIGIASCLAFLPVALMDESPALKPAKHKPFGQQLRQAVGAAGRSPAVWLGGFLESSTYVSIYALKAFLPVYALDQGYTALVAGTFFALQEAVHIVAKPLGGRVADRLGHLRVMVVAMVAIAATLALVPWGGNAAALYGLAAGLGFFQAFLFPASSAFVADQVATTDLGAALGLVGTMDNLGKVVGPLLGGLLLTSFSFATSFGILALVLALTAVVAFIFISSTPDRQNSTSFHVDTSNGA
ncbi:MAG: MFS transporter [Anaerolineales bacterium]|nr:MFS transporter [Anaerolineales bacterium]MCB0030949.1 MFS transporter [Anaerolineales bacterium]